MSGENTILGSAGGAAAGGLAGNGTPRSLNTYPNQYFDLSSQEIPRTIKELFRWCLYLYLSHSEIAPLINKKCSYVITDLVYDTESEKDKKAWQTVLEDILDIREFEFKMLLDYEIFGNAFCSISFPFERQLSCNDCQAKIKIQDPKLEWHYRDHKFLGLCPECKSNVQFTPEDNQVKRRKSLKLIRWFPEYIQIVRNEITGHCRYIYKIPRWIRKGIANSENDENKYLVEDMPAVFLDAVKTGKDVELDKDNFYHMRVPSCSYYDQSYGIPPMLAIFKDAWLFQTYRRAQEAIAIEHVLPLRLLIPRPASGDHSPHVHNDLGQWSTRMQNIVHTWRRDQNAFFTVPFPAEVQNIGGDAQALNVHNDMTQIRAQIAGGLDIPADMIYGNMNWSGSSVTLRMLENIFLGRITQLEKFLNRFVIDKLAAWADLPDIDIRHRDFKMADDAQQKQIALSLRQTNTLSDRTVIQELGFDYSTEQKYKLMEEEDRNQTLLRQMVSQATAQGQAQILSAEFEAQAEAARQKATAESAKDTQLEAYGKILSPAAQTEMAQITQAVGSPAAGELGGSRIEMSSAIYNTMAESLLKATPPEAVDDMLVRTGKTNPGLAAAVLRVQKKGQQALQTGKPLPDQKPPRSPNSGI